MSAVADTVKRKPSADVQKNLYVRIWAPNCIGLPVCAGLPSSVRDDPVPKNLLFSEAGPDG